VTAAVVPHDAEPLSKAIHRILVSNYGRFRHGAKTLAIHAKCTPRAAENWLDGSCTPNAEKLVNVMAECDELAAEIMRRAGRYQCSP
jgi:hypothetical protein